MNLLLNIMLDCNTKCHEIAMRCIRLVTGNG